MFPVHFLLFPVDSYVKVKASCSPSSCKRVRRAGSCSCIYLYHLTNATSVLFANSFIFILYIFILLTNPVLFANSFIFILLTNSVLFANSFIFILLTNSVLFANSFIFILLTNSVLFANSFIFILLTNCVLFAATGYRGSGDSRHAGLPHLRRVCPVQRDHRRGPLRLPPQTARHQRQGALPALPAPQSGYCQGTMAKKLI